MKSLVILLALIILSQSGLAASGDTLKAFSTPYMCPQGLAYDGKFIWCGDRRSDMIYKIDPDDGAVKDSLKSPGYSIRGLAWDGTHLWCVDAGEGRIYAINTENGIAEKIIYCPVSRPYDLAWDGKYLWITDDAENMLHQISTEDGTTIVSIKAPWKLPGGLTFDGKYLWVSDRYSDKIYMINPDDGDCLIVWESPGPYPCGLAWDGTSVWSVDYQNDRIYQHVVDDGTLFTHLEKKSQAIDFIHQVRNFGPDTVKTMDIYLAIPENLNTQELLGEVIFTPDPMDILQDQWGQEVAHFHFDDMPAGEMTEVMMHAEANLYQTRYFIFPDNCGTLDDIPDEIKKSYLIDDAKFDLGNPIIQKGVKAAVGDETNPYWIARKIYNYIIDKVEYERVGGWNIAPTVLDRGTGSCSEYSFVFIAMCRAAGLPARYVGSLVVRGDDASWDDVFHRWCEIYLPNYGWIPVDPSGGDSEWPAERANSFGYLNNRFLITTAGGGGSQYLEWDYNGHERWTSKGRVRIEVENLGEWSPLKETD